METTRKSRALRDPAVMEARMGLLREAHVSPLNAFVDGLREELAETVPYFDPAGPGVNGRILYLGPNPGPPGSGSGIVSPENDDVTSENLLMLRSQASVDEDLIVDWNYVPWYVDPPAMTRRYSPKVPDGDVDDAGPYLPPLLELLPSLRAVLLVGDTARQGWDEYAGDAGAAIEVVSCPDPSIRNLHSRRWHREEIVEAHRRAQRLAEAPVS